MRVALDVGFLEGSPAGSCVPRCGSELRFSALRTRRLPLRRGSAYLSAAAHSTWSWQGKRVTRLQYHCRLLNGTSVKLWIKRVEIPSDLVGLRLAEASTSRLTMYTCCFWRTHRRRKERLSQGKVQSSLAEALSNRGSNWVSERSQGLSQNASLECSFSDIIAVVNRYVQSLELGLLTNCLAKAYTSLLKHIMFEVSP